MQRIRAFIKRIRENFFKRELMRYFDWPLFLMAVAISLFSVVVIFSATSTEVTEKPATVLEMLQTQPLTYARLQLIWMIAGIVAMFFIMLFDYQIYGNYANAMYALNLIVLAVVLLMEKGRGGMSAFFRWGSNRTF